MNHAHHADDRRIDLVVNTIRKLPEEHAPESPVHNVMLFWIGLNLSHRIINGIEKPVGCLRRSRTIPRERRSDFCARRFANTKRSRHLPRLAQVRLDVGPRLARCRIGISLLLATV